jgi:uncharacterized membrane protein
MRKIVPTTLLRLAVLVALFASAVLLVEHMNAGDPAFCGAASGCTAVRRSIWSRIGPVPLPAVGLAGFAAVLGLALYVRDKTRAYHLASLAGAGGIVAAALLAIQAFQVRAFCKWCVTTDVAAIIVALASSWLHYESGRDAGFEPWLVALGKKRALIGAWIAAAVVAVALPFVWAEFPPPAVVPEGVRALAKPGQVTIVSFTDFECPYCRKMHPTLHDIVASSGGRIVIDRKMVPLPAHAGARPAALAYLCAPEDKREALASALYEAPKLRRGPILDLAAKIGLDRDATDRCMDAPATEKALKNDMELFNKLSLFALPYTLVGDRVIVGSSPSAARRAARIALAGGRPSLPASWMVVAFAIVALLTAAATPLLAPREEREPREKAED